MLTGTAVSQGSACDEWRFYTPAAVRELRDQTDTEIMTASSDAVAAWAAGQIPSSAFLPFRTFVQEWQKYSAGVNWFDELFASSTVCTINDFRTRLIDWRRKLGDVGVSFASPEPTLPPPSTSQFTTIAKWLAIAGITIAGAYVVGKSLDLIPRGKVIP